MYSMNGTVQTRNQAENEQGKLCSEACGTGSVGTEVNIRTVLNRKSGAEVLMRDIFEDRITPQHGCARNLGIWTWFGPILGEGMLKKRLHMKFV